MSRCASAARGWLPACALGVLLAAGCEQGKFSLFGEQGKNVPPTVSITNTITGTQSGTILFNYSVTDPEGANVTLLYSPTVDGTTTLPATPLTITGGSGTGTLSWNTIANSVGLTGPVTVTVTLSAFDGQDTRTTSVTFTVDNSIAVTIDNAATLMAAAQAGTFPIDFTTVDPLSSNVNVVMTFTVSGGPSNTATTVPASPILIALGNGSSSFSWDTRTETGGPIGPTGPVSVTVTLTATSGVRSGTATVTFNIDNNTPPTVVITLVTGTSSNITVDFTSNDPENQPMTVTLEYSTDGGNTYSAATVTGTNPITGFLNAGNPGQFVWDSLADAIAFCATQAVTLRVTGDDGGPTPGTDTSTLTVDNTATAPPAASTAVIKDAGGATITEATINDVITLDGTGSTGISFLWTQTAGPMVTIADPLALVTTFTAPATVPYATLTFDLQATACGAPVSTTVSVTVFEDVTERLFVNLDTGNDATAQQNDKVNAWRSIGMAILAARNNWGSVHDIYVAGGADGLTGTHDVEGAVGQGLIEMEGPISVYGGFEATNWTRLDVTNPANRSVIIDTRVDATGTATLVTLNTRSSTATFPDTYLDGFEINGGTAHFLRTIRIGNASDGPHQLTMRYLTINSGTAIEEAADPDLLDPTDWGAGSVEGIRMQGGNARIINSEIVLGNTVSTNSGDNGSVVGIQAGGGLSTIDVDGVTITAPPGLNNGNANIYGILLGGNVATPVCNITNSTVDLNGSVCNRSLAIDVQGNSVAIINTFVRGGASNFQDSHGVRFWSTGPSNPTPTATLVIDKCEIHAGENVAGATKGSKGIYIQIGSEAITQMLTPISITNSYISGGLSEYNNLAIIFEIQNGEGGLNNAAGIIANNTINAGEFALRCKGIELTGDQSGTAGPSLTIVNNILFCTSVGTGTGGGNGISLIDENGPNTAPAEFQNNLMFIDATSTATRIYYEGITMNLGTQNTLRADVNTNIPTVTTIPVLSSNINLIGTETNLDVITAMGVGPALNFHLQTATANPAIDAGMDASAISMNTTTDIDGDTRPNGSFFDIGADEN